MRFLAFFCLLFSSLFAKEIHATYKVSFGIFGQIGEAKAAMKIDDNGTYVITMLAEAEGLARVLSGGRKEWFTSRGKLLPDGMLRPDFYEHKVVRKSQEVKDPFNSDKWEEVIKTKVKRFTFDHEHKRVQKQQIKSKNEEVIEEPYAPLEYYASNDLLSLFFNFKVLSREFALNEPTKMYAVGANKEDGRVDVIPPRGKMLLELQEELEKKRAIFILPTSTKRSSLVSEGNSLLI